MSTHEAFQRTLVDACNDIISATDLDPSFSNSNLETYLDSAVDNFPESVFPEMWYMATMAVHPSYQRRGIGSTLLNWGLEHARRENIPVGTEASAEGEQLYVKHGFKVVSAMEWSEGHSSPVMIWEPEGGSWVELARAAAEEEGEEDEEDESSRT